MNRSTNLFYANGENSKFITFANYTESLTGNFMSTNTKLFPSKFICMQIDGLNTKTKPVFIKYLAAYYENKMAFLRDHLENNNETPDTNLKPLNYLLEALTRLQGFKQHIKIDKDRYNNIRTIFADLVLYRKNTANPLEYKRYYVVNTTSKTDETGEPFADTFWSDNYDDQGNYIGGYTNPDDYFDIRTYDSDGNASYCTDGELLVKAQAFLNAIDTEYEYYLLLVYENTEMSTEEKEFYKILKSYSSYNNKDAYYDPNGGFTNNIGWTTVDDTIEAMEPAMLIKVITDVYTELNTLYYYDEVTDLSDLTIAKYSDIPEILNDSTKCYAYITFVGDVTELDYNGTYSDTICVIDSSDYPRGIVTVNSEKTDTGYENMNAVEYINSEETISEDYLYGWAEYKVDTTGDENNIKWYPKVPGYYYNVKPITDDEVETTTDDNGDEVSSGGRYYLDSIIGNIDLTTTIFGGTDLELIEFNILIPLYDVVDVDYTSNTTTIEDGQDYLLDDVNTNFYNQCVPMGIWFSGDESVVLKRTDPSGYFPSWSLTLASQFKPFPASVYMPTEVNSTDSRTEAWATFSQVLTKQNDILDTLTSIQSTVSSLSTRLTTLESKVNTVGSAYYLDDLHREMLDFESDYNTKFEEFQNTMYSYASALTWTYRQS